MPRDTIARVRPTVAECIGRPACIVMLSMLGTAGVTLVLAVGSTIHAAIAWGAMHGPGLAESIFVMPIMGGIFGGFISPIPILFMIRKPLDRCAKRVYGITMLAAITALIHPLIGGIVVVAVFMGMCVDVARHQPTVWPAPVPVARCAGCNYDLTGLDQDRCPECGRDRPGPRECHVCRTPLITPDQNAQPWEKSPLTCKGCGHEFDWNLLCQRCGSPLTPESRRCPGCARETRLVPVSTI